MASEKLIFIEAAAFPGTLDGKYASLYTDDSTP
jgi:hypothetical protein